MPRACAVEERLVTEHHESLQKSKTLETGLLVGQVGGKADALLRLVPTPPQEDAAGGATIDAKWMLQHAAQVARMLPGGIAVMGCYVFAANAKLAKVESMLQSTLAAIAKRLDASVAERQALLLLMPSDAKKTTCRALAAGAGARVQPFELKTSATPPQVRRLTRRACAISPHICAAGWRSCRR
jgi:hypothetical protein